MCQQKNIKLTLNWKNGDVRSRLPAQQTTKGNPVENLIHGTYNNDNLIRFMTGLYLIKCLKQIK